MHWKDIRNKSLLTWISLELYLRRLLVSWKVFCICWGYFIWWFPVVWEKSPDDWWSVPTPMAQRKPCVRWAAHLFNCSNVDPYKQDPVSSSTFTMAGAGQEGARGQYDMVCHHGKFGWSWWGEWWSLWRFFSHSLCFDWDKVQSNLGIYSSLLEIFWDLWTQINKIVCVCVFPWEDSRQEWGDG